MNHTMILSVHQQNFSNDISFFYPGSFKASAPQDLAAADTAVAVSAKTIAEFEEALEDFAGEGRSQCPSSSSFSPFRLVVYSLFFASY